METEAIAKILGGQKVLGRAVKKPDDLAHLVRQGLPAWALGKSRPVGRGGRGPLRERDWERERDQRSIIHAEGVFLRE
jgi:hypothetical protein